MIALVFTLCVTGTSICETHRMLAYENELTCMAQAQAVLAQHYREGMTVARFGCERGGQ